MDVMNQCYKEFNLYFISFVLKKQTFASLNLLMKEKTFKNLKNFKIYKFLKINKLKNLNF